MHLQRPQVHRHLCWNHRWTVALRLRPRSAVRVSAVAPQNDNAWATERLGDYLTMRVRHEVERVARYEDE